MKSDKERLKILEEGLKEMIDMVKSDLEMARNFPAIMMTLDKYMENELEDLNSLLEESK